MKNLKYLVLLPIIAIAVYFFVFKKYAETKENTSINIELNKLKEVTKLVIWEQDFVLNDIEEKERKYLKFFTTKETVSTTINGKMGFHVDLSDTSSTKISKLKDSIYIVAPLRITYVSLDLGSLKQVKESSVDPTLDVDKEEVIKKLDQKALAKYLPQVKSFIETQPLTYQEKQLTNLLGKPVKLIISSVPTIYDWKK